MQGVKSVVVIVCVCKYNRYVKLSWINELQGNNCYRKDAVSVTYRMNADATDRIREEVNYAKM